MNYIKLFKKFQAYVNNLVSEFNHLRNQILNNRSRGRSHIVSKKGASPKGTPYKIMKI